jgi:hypothetical protein
MSYVLLIASWFFAAIFGLATVSFFLMGLAPQAWRCLIAISKSQ